MNVSISGCSSGCESGWTNYLDQSSNSADQFHKFGGGMVDENYRRKAANEELEDEEDEDLSMVSDASSGPPHFHEDEDCSGETGYFCYASEQAKKMKKKKKIKEHKGKQQHSYLDDTASSPILSFSKKNVAFSANEASMENVLGFSQGNSATQFKGKSAFRKHFGFLQSSLPGKPASGAAGQGRKWE
ncbi:hypothetical protein F0562_035806 [Nyssa sinensis]|uniref:Uncharacterized protein n=1 Tax=Nyssa sinensis TaxID=561372 RepID=A0A5J5AH29_9ASTE|nr:hypothetical protein F0562_035806 [Nyssa sinensis]